MSTMKKITVLTPNGRRQNISLKPSTTLLEVLDQVCQKHKFNSAQHGLKHHNKPVDLSQMFRFSGLPNNCLLEMFETANLRNDDKDVSLCIQLENGDRPQGVFNCSKTLTEVLIELCPENLNSNENVVIVYMGHELYGDALKETTLRSLGITEGRAMIRLFNKHPEELKNQASVSAPLPRKEKTESEEEPTQIVKKTGAVGTSFAVSNDMIKKLKQGEQVETKDNKEKETLIIKAPPKPDWGTSAGRSLNESEQKTVESALEEDVEEDEPVIFELGERHAIVFSLDDTQKISNVIPDSFFDLTVEDLKLILRDLKKQSTGDDDVPLLTKKLRELDQDKKILKKLGQYKNSVIRIQFPDRYVLQGVFKPTEKINEIYEFVKKYLKDDTLKFELFTTPPKSVAPVDKTLIEADYVPTSLLHINFEGTENNNEGSFLKESILQNLTSPDGALLSATKSRGLIKSRSHNNETVSPTNGATSNVSTNNEPSSSSKANTQRRNNKFRDSSVEKPKESSVPAWFQIFKKK